MSLELYWEREQESFISRRIANYLYSQRKRIRTFRVFKTYKTNKVAEAVRDSASEGLAIKSSQKREDIWL